MRGTTSSTKSTGADRVRDGIVVAVALLTVAALTVAGSVGVAAVTTGQSTAGDPTGATDPTGTGDPTTAGPTQRVRAAPLQASEHTLEVVPRGADATYLIEVSGTIEGANVDGREPNPTDEIHEHTVVGQVVAGFQGDSYRYTGEIVSITLLEGDAEFRRDGGVVDPAQFDGEQTEHVLEIVPDDTDASYEVAVSGTIEAADVNGRDVNPDDQVDERSVEGRVSAGFDGDSYRYTGEILSVAFTDGNATVLRDGEEIDPARFDGNGSTEPSIEFVNCTAARVTGDYAEIEFSGHWNVRDGVSTGLLSLSREEVRNRSGVVSSTEFWDDASVGGTVLDGVTVYDEDFDVLAEATRTNDDCSRRLRPAVNVSVADVRQAGSGTYEVTFAYANDHDEPLYYGPQELRGSVADDTRNRLPDEFAPGEHAFTVTWTPASEDERLTWWIGANGSFTGVDEPLTARTEPAAAYQGGNGSGGDGSDGDQANGSHTIEVVPTGPDTTYRIEVTGTIEAADVNGRDVNPDDEIGARTVTGHVAGDFDGDSYRYTGELVDVTVVEGDATFLVDGREVIPGRIGSATGSTGDGSDENPSVDGEASADGSPAAESPAAEASTAESQTDGSGTTGADSDVTASPEAASASDDQGTTDPETTDQNTPTEATAPEETTAADPATENE